VKSGVGGDADEADRRERVADERGGVHDAAEPREHRSQGVGAVFGGFFKQVVTALDRRAELAVAHVHDVLQPLLRRLNYGTFEMVRKLFIGCLNKYLKTADKVILIRQLKAKLIFSDKNLRFLLQLFIYIVTFKLYHK